MATNPSSLKIGTGASLPADKSEDAIGANPGAVEKAPLRPLQVRVSEKVFAEFSEQAGREFGFVHGAKKRLFLKMWEVYKAQCM